MGGYNKIPISFPIKEPKRCLLYSISPGWNCSCENVLCSAHWQNTLTAKSEVSQSRYENKSLGNNLFENMKVAQNMRSLLAAWKKRNRIDHCTHNMQNQGQPSKSSAEGRRKKSDTEKLSKERKGKKNMFDPLPLACTDAHRRSNSRLHDGRVISLPVSSSGERWIGKDQPN